MKKLLLIENAKGNQFDSEKEAVEFLFGKKYYALMPEERKKHMLINAHMKCAGTDMEVVELKERISVKNKFVVYDEKTYVLSLLIVGRVMLLEHIDSNIYTEDLDKTGIDKNYIIVNKFAEELLQKYVDRIFEKDSNSVEDEYPKAYNAESFGADLY